MRVQDKHVRGGRCVLAQRRYQPACENLESRGLAHDAGTKPAGSTSRRPTFSSSCRISIRRARRSPPPPRSSASRSSPRRWPVHHRSRPVRHADRDDSRYGSR